MGQCEYSLVHTKDYFYWFGQVYITYHINKKVTDCLNNLAKKCNVLITSSEVNSYASFDFKKEPFLGTFKEMFTLECWNRKLNHIDFASSGKIAIILWYILSI